MCYSLEFLSVSTQTCTPYPPLRFPSLDSHKHNIVMDHEVDQTGVLKLICWSPMETVVVPRPSTHAPVQDLDSAMPGDVNPSLSTLRRRFMSGRHSHLPDPCRLHEMEFRYRPGHLCRTVQTFKLYRPLSDPEVPSSIPHSGWVGFHFKTNVDLEDPSIMQSWKSKT